MTDSYKGGTSLPWWAWLVVFAIAIAVVLKVNAEAAEKLRDRFRTECGAQYLEEVCENTLDADHDTCVTQATPWVTVRRQGKTRRERGDVDLDEYLLCMKRAARFEEKARQARLGD